MKPHSGTCRHENWGGRCDCGAYKYFKNKKMKLSRKDWADIWNEIYGLGVTCQHLLENIYEIEKLINAKLKEKEKILRNRNKRDS